MSPLRTAGLLLALAVVAYVIAWLLLPHTFWWAFGAGSVAGLVWSAVTWDWSS